MKNQSQLKNQSQNAPKLKAKNLKRKTGLILEKVKNAAQKLKKEKANNRNNSGSFIYSKEGLGYIPYGLENEFFDLYPQYLITLIRNSQTLATSIQLKSDFIYGSGFENEKLGVIKINKKGETLNDLLYSMAASLATFEGFALHLNWNAAGQITEINPLNFEVTRRGIPDKEGNIHKTAIVNYYEYYLYGYQQNKHIVDFYDNYNPEPKVIQEQAFKALEKRGKLQPGKDRTVEAYKAWKGQIFYYFRKKPGVLYYPTPIYDSVLEDAESENLAKISKRYDIEDRFKPTTIVTEFGKNTMNEEERNRLINEYQGYVGADGARFVVRFAENKESAPEVQTLNVQDLAKNYEYAERSVKENIRRVFRFPDILHGEAQAGKLGQANEITDHAKYGNALVKKDRQVIESTLKELFSKFNKHIEADFKINDLTLL